METARKMAILKDAAQRIKSFGFKVDICVGESGLAWGVYTDGKTVGGFDVDGFGFMSVKTRHRPASGVGTGICVRDEMLASEITEDICREGLSLCPRWWKDSVKNIVKYTPEEFFKQESEKWGNRYDEI